MFLCYIDADNTDVPEELSDDENVEDPFIGPDELMNIMSNLVEEHNGYDLVRDTADEDKQAKVIVFSSEEDNDRVIPDMNFLPLMENFVEVQTPGIFEERPIIEDVQDLDIPELPIIEEVVISSPNQNNVPHHTSDLLQPTSIQQQMMNMMEEVTQFADRILQGMKNRMRPLRYEEQRLSAVQDPRESNRNLPIRVIPIKWQELSEDNGMDVAERDEGSHGIATQHEDNPSTVETDEAPSVKNEEGKETQQHELKPEAKPEGKSLIRTERVTELDEPKHSSASADQPVLHVIQQLGASTNEGKSEIK